MHCIMGAILSKLNELWQEYIKHKPGCAHVLVCSCEGTEEVMRDECVISVLGVRGGYKAMNGGVHVRACIEEEELKGHEMVGDTGGEGVYRVSWEQDMADSGVWVAGRFI